MESIICILTFGANCGWVDDNRHQAEAYRQPPPPIESPAPAVPEPASALLFGAGLTVAAIIAQRNR